MANAPNVPPPIVGLLVGQIQWTGPTYFFGLVHLLDGLPLDRSRRLDRLVQSIVHMSIFDEDLLVFYLGFAKTCGV